MRYRRGASAGFAGATSLGGRIRKGGGAPLRGHFERAAELRDRIKALRKIDLQVR